MTTITAISALWDQLYVSDTDLHGFTQIPDYNNSINIFQPEHSTITFQCQHQEVTA